VAGVGERVMDGEIDFEDAGEAWGFYFQACHSGFHTMVPEYHTGGGDWWKVRWTVPADKIFELR